MTRRILTEMGLYRYRGRESDSTIDLKIGKTSDDS